MKHKFTTVIQVFDGKVPIGELSLQAIQSEFLINKKDLNKGISKLENLVNSKISNL